ncbi:hypothetical protein ABIB06_003053 [Bradyrhizobium sp. LB8.2]
MSTRLVGNLPPQRGEIVDDTLVAPVEMMPSSWRRLRIRLIDWRVAPIMRANITNLRINCTGPRPAAKSLAPAATSATGLSTNRRSTPVLPIRSDPPTFSIASAKRVQRTSHTHRQRRIPIAPDVPPRPTSRGFLLWRFSYAGPRARGAIIVGRHPKTFTIGDIRDVRGRRRQQANSLASYCSRTPPFLSPSRMSSISRRNCGLVDIE